MQASNDKWAEYSSGVVRDRRGNERFHGAFAGGWSAGYFNSVGSKEGWEPSTFVSSRKSKNPEAESSGLRYQTPEDLMDEEDKATLLGQKLQSSNRYDTFGTKRHGAVWDRIQQETKEGQRQSFAVGADQWASIVAPPTDSIGAQILQKMGWRHGQGIGRKILRKEKHGKEDEEADTDEVNPLDEALVAPPPTQVYQPEGYTGYHGLGYQREGMDVSNVFSGSQMKALTDPNAAGSKALVSTTGMLQTTSKQPSNKLNMADVLKKPSGAHALGIEHDDDTYGLGFQEESYDIPQTKAEALAEKQRKEETKSHRDIEHQRDDPSVLTAGLLCHDGRPALDGFHLRTTRRQLGISRLNPDKIEPPKNFVPNHKFAHPPPPVRLKFQGLQWSSERARSMNVTESETEGNKSTRGADTTTHAATSSSTVGNTFSTGDLADRFVSAGSLEKEKELTKENLKVSQTQEDEDAAKAFKDFLSLTPSRTIKEWLPTKLVCKRFNVRTPRKLLQQEEQQADSATSQPYPGAASARNPNGPPQRAQVPGGSMVPEKLEPGERPPVDLMSAVFNVGSYTEDLSSSDSDSEDEEPEKDHREANKTSQPSSVSASDPMISNAATGVGVTGVSHPKDTGQSLTAPSKDTDSDESSDGSSRKRSKDHKKKHKRKHKHKSKSKTKKKRRRTSSPSSAKTEK